MHDVTPIFYDHSSMKSIMTWWDGKDVRETAAPSIPVAIRELGLKQVVFVSKNFSTYLEAKKACDAIGVKLIFGIEFVMCEDAKIRTPESVLDNHKVIVFCKNYAGYEALLKMFTDCNGNIDNKYYVHRFDYMQLEKAWHKDLKLAIPFFDGFIAKNAIRFGKNIVPDLHFADKFLMKEIDTEHPLEAPINRAIEKFNKTHSWPVQPVKTIYYNKKEEFEAYMVYRCIQAGTEFSDPKLEMMCSDTFCVETFKSLKT